MIKFAAALALALSLGGTAAAQDYDADGDGAVSRAELEGAILTRFAAADGNGDAKLDAGELAASFADPGQLLYIVDADQDSALNEEEWRGYAAGAAAIAFMLCDSDQNDTLAGDEIACAQ